MLMLMTRPTRAMGRDGFPSPPHSLPSFEALMIAHPIHYSLSPSSPCRSVVSCGPVLLVSGGGGVCSGFCLRSSWRSLNSLLQAEATPDLRRILPGAMRVLPASWSAKLTTSSSSTEDPPPPSAAAVYLNIYDISPLNHYLYWFGLGIFHSGIEGKPTIPYSPALGFLTYIRTYIGVHACLICKR